MIVNVKIKAAVVCLIGTLAPAASAQENGADRSLGNAQLAVAALSGGLAEGASAEAGAAAGLKAEELLVSGRAGDSGPGAVDASRGGQARRLAHGLAASPAKLKAAAAVPPPGVEPAKPAGLVDGLLQGVSALTRPAARAFGGLGKAKKIALLVGLLAVEAAAVLYPYQVVGVAMTALGVLGLFGTAREIVGMIRRRDS